MIPILTKNLKKNDGVRFTKNVAELWDNKSQSWIAYLPNLPFAASTLDAKNTKFWASLLVFHLKMWFSKSQQKTAKIITEKCNEELKVLLNYKILHSGWTFLTNVFQNCSQTNIILFNNKCLPPFHYFTYWTTILLVLPTSWWAKFQNCFCQKIPWFKVTFRWHS